MALEIKDKSKVYHLRFHTDDAKINNICTVTTTDNYSLLHPSYRSSSDDNRVLVSDRMYINTDNTLKKDFYIHFLIGINTTINTDISDETTKTAFNNFINNTYNATYNATLVLINKSNTGLIQYQFKMNNSNMNDIVISRSGDACTLYIDGKKVYQTTVSGELSNLAVFLNNNNTSKVPCNLLLDDFVIIDGESIVSGDTINIDKTKSVLGKNSAVIDGSKTIYGVTAK